MSTTNNFSVNLGLNNADCIELKNIILDFIKKKAESKIVEFYRPSEEKEKNSLGLIIGSDLKPGDPSEEKFNELLDLVKKIKPLEENTKDPAIITIPLPI